MYGIVENILIFFAMMDLKLNCFNFSFRNSQLKISIILLKVGRLNWSVQIKVTRNGLFFLLRNKICRDLNLFLKFVNLNLILKMINIFNSLLKNFVLKNLGHFDT